MALPPLSAYKTTHLNNPNNGTNKFQQFLSPKNEAVDNLIQSMIIKVLFFQSLPVNIVSKDPHPFLNLNIDLWGKRILRTGTNTNFATLFVKECRSNPLFAG